MVLFHAKNVPRGTFLGEWETFGAVCCMSLVFSRLQLRNLLGICALLQRMEILACSRTCRIGPVRDSGRVRVRPVGLHAE